MAASLLKDRGEAFSAVNYYEKPLTTEKLTGLIRKMGIPAQALFRESEAVYKELKLGQRDVSEAEAIELMVKHPDLMQRPIVERGDRAVLARPPERLSEIL